MEAHIFNMTFKQSLVVATIFAIIGLAFGLVSFGLLIGIGSAHGGTSQKFGNFDAGISAMARSTTVSVGTGSTGVASSSSGRRFLQIQNTSGTTAVYCAYSGTTPAVGSQGFFIAASSTFALPIGDGPMYTGSINCIASSTVALLVNEG